jgi:flagellar biosynthesis GTPase FlhF
MSVVTKTMNTRENSTNVEGAKGEAGSATPGRTGQATSSPSPALSSAAGAPAASVLGDAATTEACQTQTNRLTAETLRLIAEANEFGARQLQELKRIGEWLHRDLVGEAGRLAQLDKDLRERQTVVQRDEKLYREGVELKLQAEAQAQENQRGLAEAQSRKAAAEKAERRASEEIKSNEQAAATARAEQERAKALLLESQSEREKAEAVRNDAARSLQEAQQLHEETEKLQAQLLPKAFQGESWRAWREEVIRRAATEGPVSLLVARLHTAAALERSARPLTMELLRDIGRSVYETQGQQAEKIAPALAQNGRGQFDIKTVRVGDRVDNKFMKPSASGLVEVRNVLGWAVRDAKGSWQFLAEVS